MTIKIITWLVGLLGGTVLKKISSVIVIAMIASTYFYVTNEAYNKGVTVTTSKYEKAQAEAVNKALLRADKKNEASKSISQAYWENELAKKPKIKTIEKRIVEYVEVQSANDPDECLLDDSELFIIQDLVSIANSTKNKDRYGVNTTLQRDSSTDKEKQVSTLVMEKTANTFLRGLQGQAQRFN
jgi:hypothetical protein